MGVELAAGVAALVGLATGFAAAFAVRLSERAQRMPPQPAFRLPPGVAAVLSVLPSSAVVLDNEDRVLRASSAARAYGLVKGDRLVAGELLALARSVRRDGEIREREIDVTGRGPNRDTTSFAVRVAPLGTAGGGVAGIGGGGLVLVLAEDQTERRRVEAVRRDFVAGVSHELKTPVGALALLAEAIESAASDPVAIRRFAGQMQREASRLTNVVQDVIMLSRVQSGTPLEAMRQVSVDEVVHDTIDRCRLGAEAKRIVLVSGGTSGLSVLGDEDLLVTATRNLVDNAVNYSPEGTRVVIATRQVDDSVEISVTDQGIGIPAAEQGRIFERFYRVDPARSRNTGGTGLGLAIVKHVLAAHGGEVTVWSKEGSGSTFTLRLPAHASPSTAGRVQNRLREALP